MSPKPRLSSFLLSAGITLMTLASGRAAIINQTVNQPGGTPNWSTSAIWGTPAAAPVANHSYITTAGFVTGFDNGLGVLITGTIRDNGSVFPLNSTVTLSPSTELLLKGGNGSTTTGNIILNGGAVRYGPNGTNPLFTTAIAGTLDIAAPSVIGLGGNNTMIVSSSLSGSSTLGLRAAAGATAPVTLSLSGDLSNFSGILDLGGGPGALTLDFNQDYLLNAALVMGTHASADILKLDQAITVNSFEFGGTSLDLNTYTATDLNTLFGNGTQFIGEGTLTVVPEPGSALLGLLGSLLLFRRRRSTVKP